MSQIKMSAKDFVEAIKNGDALPEGIVVNANVNLSGYKGNISLPNNLTISGCLNLYNSSIAKLPQGFSCERLDIYDCNITSLPNDIQVSKCLNAKHSSLTCLPQGFCCKVLDIRGCNITEFPDNLTISEQLWYGPNPIMNEPQNLTLPPDEKIYYFSE